MSTSDAELETQVFEAYKAVQLDMAHGSPFDELLAGFENIGQRFIPIFEARGEASKAAAIRIGVAQNIMTAALTTARPVAECEEWLERCLELGFSDLSRKAIELIAFCGDCARRGSTQRVLRHLLPLMAELEAEHARTGDQIWGYYLRICRRIHARVKRRIRSRQRAARRAAAARRATSRSSS
ncbi:hypothetical protein [Haliangium sp.]|uniref:hypothetical protein n=1 Tax=Haliangium sp. TaxID=2663208 RepID=UPI003D0B9896